MTTVSTSSPSTSPDDVSIQTEPLRCADASMPILDTRHPFVAFKETNPASGAWRVRIKSRYDTAAVLYPNAIRLQARAVSAQGKSTFAWNNTTDAQPVGPRKPQVLVHVNDGEPAAIEILPSAANSYSTATQVPTRFCWPSARS